MALPAQTSLLRRAIVLVALLGVVVVTHLALQQANGFAAGCTGFGEVDFTAATTGETAGCATVLESEYADFFGIPNVWLGLIFYVVVAGLRLAYAARQDDRLRLASAGVVGVGVLYTAYLVYLQAAVIGSFCPLCMTSAALVLTLAILLVIEHRRLQSPSPSSRRPANEGTGVAALRPYLPVFGLFAVLLVGTFGLAAQTAPEEEPVAQALLPTPDIRQVAGACEFDPEFEPIAGFEAFLGGPSKGPADAAVEIVKVFDPNCPHCRSLSETLDAFIAENPDAARFTYVPYPLRQQSVGQVLALKVAEDEGRFFELMDAMFARQDATWGMSVDEIVESMNAAGLDGAAFAALLESGSEGPGAAELQALLAEVEADAARVTEAFARPDGGISVPKLAVAGRVVASTYASYSARCLAEFIAEAEAGPSEAPATTEG